MCRIGEGCTIVSAPVEAYISTFKGRESIIFPDFSEFIFTKG